MGDVKVKEQIQKKWQESTIQNNFVFSKTMEKNPDLCRRLVGYILNSEIKKINYPEREKTLENRIDSKGIRLDVYFEDDAERVFDLEMQVSSTSDNLAQRMRYYQGVIDGDKLKHGGLYKMLKPTYIIFVCPFAPFPDKSRVKRHVYTFRELCEQDPSLKLQENGTIKMMLSTEGEIDDVHPEVKNFLDYVDRGVINSPFIKELDEAVQGVKCDRILEVAYMTFEMALLESREEGREEGRRENAAKYEQVISRKDRELSSKDKEIRELKKQLALAKRAATKKSSGYSR